MKIALFPTGPYQLLLILAVLKGKGLFDLSEIDVYDVGLSTTYTTQAIRSICTHYGINYKRNILDEIRLMSSYAETIRDNFSPYVFWKLIGNNRKYVKSSLWRRYKKILIDYVEYDFVIGTYVNCKVRHNFYLSFETFEFVSDGVSILNLPVHHSNILDNLLNGIWIEPCLENLESVRRDNIGRFKIIKKDLLYDIFEYGSTLDNIVTAVNPILDMIDRKKTAIVFFSVYSLFKQMSFEEEFEMEIDILKWLLSRYEIVIVKLHPRQDVRRLNLYHKFLPMSDRLLSIPADVLAMPFELFLPHLNGRVEFYVLPSTTYLNLKCYSKAKVIALYHNNLKEDILEIWEKICPEFGVKV